MKRLLSVATLSIAAPIYYFSNFSSPLSSLPPFPSLTATSMQMSICNKICLQQCQHFLKPTICSSSPCLWLSRRFMTSGRTPLDSDSAMNVEKDEVDPSSSSSFLPGLNAEAPDAPVVAEGSQEDIAPEEEEEEFHQHQQQQHQQTEEEEKEKKGGNHHYYSGSKFSRFRMWQKGLFASVGACMGVGSLAYFLWAPLKDDTVQKTAEVASGALADGRLKEQALVLSKEVVASILKDEGSVVLLSQVINKVLAMDDTKLAVSSLLKTLLDDHYTQEVTKEFVLKIMSDDWVKEKLQSIAHDLVVSLLADPKTRKVMTDFLLETTIDALRQEEFHVQAGSSMRKSAYRAVVPW